MSTRWLPIEQFEGNYEVSNTGLIRSIHKVITKSDGKTYTRVSKILKHAVDSNGYCRCAVSFNNKLITVKVHRVVATGFLGKSNLTANHINGIKSDNRVENLEWLSHSENIKKSFKTTQQDNFKKTVRINNMKRRALSIEKFKEFAADCEKGLGCYKLALKYNINKKTALLIQRKETYKDLWNSLKQ